MAAQTLNAAFPSVRLERFSHLAFHFKQPLPSSFQIPTLRSIRCRAAAKSPPTGPLKKRSSSSSSSSSSSTTTNKNNNKNNKKKNNNNYNKSNGGVHDSNSKPLNSSGFEIVNDDDATSTSYSSLPTPLPKPPAGFVVDDRGKVLAASKHRLATLVDPTNNRPLECAIRRVFTSSQGHECMLLCPVDMPVQILKSTGVGWSDVSDEELESILPAAAYALAKIRMYLVYSGYCYTARGGFCYSEEDIFDFHPDGKESDGLPTEGVEITHFNLEEAHYMIYTPSDPLLFVVVKDQNGMLQIADDELLEDPAIISAIDEETEFNALVEEEAALLESLLGKR